MQHEEFNDIRIVGQIGVSRVGDDTKLIAKVASKIKCKSVLDVGIGTGFIPIYLSSLGCKCAGVDINKFAIFCARKNARINKVNCKFYFSDLFEKVRGKFDLITFNPPFGNTSSHSFTRLLEVIKSVIPKDNDLFIKTSYLVIQKQRRKLIKRFLEGAKKHLKKNGQILILLYPPETRLIEGYSHRKLGRYKDFSLIALRI